MRLWSLHPKYLDARGLVALWREGLLAQAVLKGETKGYLHHPQLLRFREQAFPLGCIGEYLRGVHEESMRRGYRFAVEKIGDVRISVHLTVTQGQLEFEWRHLVVKLQARDQRWLAGLGSGENLLPHPLFQVVAGKVAPWERNAGTD